jgi:4-hydroxy 2-oxovalerate aldolase
MRDGSHSVFHQFDSETITKIATALNKANVDTVEVTHGDGISGSSIQYGFSKLTDQEMLKAAKPALTTSKMAVLLLPGIGLQEDLEMAYEEGARVARVATHVTEADISFQHIGVAKKIGMEAIGFLMLAHMESPEKVLEQAKLMESYGADVVYVVDSAGAMALDDVRRRVSLLKNNLNVEVGFHAHNNMGLAIGNTIVAVEEGAGVVDGCLAGLGAGAGNTPTEVLIAVLDKLGYDTGVDLYAVMDAAEDVVRPFMTRPQLIDKAALSLGYAGVYSSFLLHTFRAAEKYGIDSRDILIELGKRRVVGGQEDMIVDVALELLKNKSA